VVKTTPPELGVWAAENVEFPVEDFDFSIGDEVI
jgi:hypothetical protein